MVTSIIGGRPGMISGATGAIAVVIGTLVAQHGVEYLFAAVVMTGVIQISMGLLKNPWICGECNSQAIT